MCLPLPHRCAHARDRPDRDRDRDPPLPLTRGAFTRMTSTFTRLARAVSNESVDPAARSCPQGSIDARVRPDFSKWTFAGVSPPLVALLALCEQHEPDVWAFGLVLSWSVEFDLIAPGEAEKHPIGRPKLSKKLASGGAVLAAGP